MADDVSYRQARRLLRRHTRRSYGWHLGHYRYWRRHVEPLVVGWRYKDQGWLFANPNIRMNGAMAVTHTGVVGGIVRSVETYDEGFERLMRGDTTPPRARRPPPPNGR